MGLACDQNVNDQGPRAADRAALVLELFDRYYPRVFAFVRRFVDASAAEDVTQEVFARLMAHEGLTGRIIGISYLLTVAHNILRRRAARDRRAKACAVSVTQARVHDRPRWSELDEDLGRRVDALSDGEREAVRLIVCQSLSYAAAATALDVTPTTVNNWRHRGLEKLRRSSNVGSSGSPPPGRGAGRAPGRPGRAA